MSIDEAISTGPLIEKLRNLKQYMPDEEDVIYQFGAYLAGSLNPRRIVPHGFIVAAEFALDDLEIRNRLVGCHYPPFLYTTLRAKVLDIAEAVCPEDFARGVKEFYYKVYLKK